ncbi:hypothetical protein CHS0354_030770 [Potamilus streckersoni]|uniref:Oxidoreductase n=1 Tax=Potamilus streckersoni TaxID=2493646 RepID=A0AAE0TEA2_9BIVA|nr:hypothetical protein CHS0354_030770 [Potamilus streckersoni]
MEVKPLRVGFIGAGAIHFGKPMVPWDHASRLENVGGFEVIGIVDPDQKRATNVLEERLSSPGKRQFYQNCQLLSNSDELLNMKPDVVFIGIPPAFRGSHKKEHDLELRFVEAGIHVFVEKPLSVVPPEEFIPYAEAVTKAVQKHNVILSVGYMFRYHAAVQKMKELIQLHGGNVMAFNARYYFAYTEGINKYWFNEDFSGGPIVEQATHFCDLARYIVGDIDMASVRCIMVKDTDEGDAGHLSHVPNHAEEDIPPAKRIPRVTISHWKFQNGGVGTLMHSVALPGTRYEANIDVQLDGLKLSLIEPYEKHCTLRVRNITSADPNEHQDFTFEDDDSYLREIETFIHAVRERDQSNIKSSYDDAAKTYQMTWAIRRAGDKN